jgi:hypothetical protein
MAGNIKILIYARYKSNAVSGQLGYRLIIPAEDIRVVRAYLNNK